MKLADVLYMNYQKIIETKPVILNLTNSVTQDFMGNALLAIGASPIMSEEQAELIELINLASSVNINIGTLNQSFQELAISAATISQQLNKPLILDPVGAGATFARTGLASQLMPAVTIVRGNASEIMALSGYASSTMGVDSRHQTCDALQSGQMLSSRYSNVIIISGEIDQIISNGKIYTNSFGSPLMTKVTGMGCVLSSIVAVFAALNDDYQLASYLAVIFYTLCAEQALKVASSPAKFKIEFIDALYAPDWLFIKHKLSNLEIARTNYVS